MEMTDAGGAALAIGIWYQSLGTAAILTPDWNFRPGILPKVYGDANGLYDRGPLTALLEYFDMDSAVSDDAGKWFVQFKVSGQQRPKEFGGTEVREVFQNATSAMLAHQALSPEPIAGFVVASNRPVGKFRLISEIARQCQAKNDGSDPLLCFEAFLAPDELFSSKSRSKSGRISKKKTSSKSRPRRPRTMHDLARSFALRKHKDWNVSLDVSTKACLNAMWKFSFAEAHPTKLRKAVNQWLSTWGILPDEYERFTTRILGSLQDASMNGTPMTELAVMREVNGAANAVPITPAHIWPSVIQDLRDRRPSDPPTPQNALNHGNESWMLDRSKVLLGLPYSFTEQPAVVGADDIDVHFVRPVQTPRIFALVGDGGVGKTTLLQQLFFQIVASVWDWGTSKILPNRPFLGCPVIRDPEVGVTGEIGAVLMRWGRRVQPFDDPIERLAHANGVVEKRPALWLGLDGWDEIDDRNLTSLARRIANYAHSHENVRIVLTARTEVFRRIKEDLNADGLLRKLEVGEFDEEQSIQALRKATDNRLSIERRLTDRTRLIPEGAPSGMTTIALEGGPFADGIRQPLFIGVLRKLYLAGKLQMIQTACKGDIESFKYLASEYVFYSCERMERRLSRRYVTARRIFRSLRQLSIDANNPSLASIGTWMNICNSQLGGQLQFGELISMCDSSGLIRDLGSGAFEWRHPLVGEFLVDIPERPEWS